MLEGDKKLDAAGGVSDCTACSTTCARLWPCDRKPVGCPDDVAGLIGGRMLSRLGENWSCVGCGEGRVPLPSNM
jgi:hypothetical protein